MDSDIMQTSVANAIVLNGSEVSLAALTDQEKGDGCIGGSAALISDNVVLVETPRGLLLSVTDGVDGVSYNSITTTADLQGRQPLITASLLGHVQEDVIVENQTSVFETSEVCDPSDSIVCSSELQLAGGTLTITDHEEPKKRKGGWPKGKKRKYTAETNAPRAPLTGYVLYAIERRQEIKESNPEIPFAEVTKILGQEWSTMGIDKKQKYLRDAEADKKRYVDELKLFQQSDTYQNFLKKKKLKGLCCQETPGLETEEGYGSLIDLEDDSLNELYCRVCNQYFSSLHNKKEHMFGRQHLQAITGEFQKDLQQQTDEQQILTSNSLISEDMNNDSVNSLSDVTDPSTGNSHKLSPPVDIQEFVHQFLHKNMEREYEIIQLRRSLKTVEDDSSRLCKQIQELKEYETKLEQDIEKLKAYEAPLAAQIDGLKMVPTLFGVINF
ncbi:hypothetical protein ScPMuIL_000221 [Solemya velum]